MQKELTRRRFLSLLAAGVAVAITGCRAESVFGPRAALEPEAAGSAPVPRPLTPEPTVQPSPTPVTVRPAPKDIAPPPMKFTPLSEFYIQHYDRIPDVDISTWRLRIDGLVENPITLTYDEVRALPAKTFVWTLECISNPAGGNLIGNQVWKGTPLVPLLEEAGIKPEAIRVRWYAADGYSNSLPLERVLHPDSMLVYEMDERPLPREHGYPLRVLIPGHYGQKMPKWLERIELIDNEYQGYWERRGWSDMATIKPNSRIDIPGRASQIALGERLIIEGVAMSDESGVARVDVGIEDREGNVVWVDTVRTQGENPYTWTVWRTAWTPERPGKYRVYARTTDGQGRTQRKGKGSLLGGAFPAGSDEMHVIVVNVKG